jgi:hypothetical protein
MRRPKVHTKPGRAAVQIFAANDRTNQILIEHLDPTAWRAHPPGKVRNIASEQNRSSKSADATVATVAARLEKNT